MKLRRRLLSLLLVSLFASVSAADEGKPNIILLYADDAGYADFGFQDHTDKAMEGLTPHIDSIASAGVRFTSAYMSGAVCSPSRAGMITGRYQARFGHELNLPIGYKEGGLPLSEKTFADRMRSVGYSTEIIGKWHLGYPADYHPNRRGFDVFYGLLQGSRGYFPLKKVSAHRVIQMNGKPTPESGYVTDRFGQRAIEAIESRGDKPFFIFLSFTAPHGPMHAKEEDLKELGHIAKDRRRKYAGMVKSLDDNVGMILAALKKNGLEKNTIVIFTNDNGGQTLTGAVNTPLRGRKGQIWEGGIRVPMAIRWPEKIKSGLVVDEPVISLDFLPTFLAAAGSEVKDEWNLDGVNLIPRLTGKAATLKERPLFWRLRGPENECAVRVGNWKLIQSDAKGSQVRLFDLSNDLGEESDLATENPSKVKELSGLIAKWQSELVEPLWGASQRKKKKDPF